MALRIGPVGPVREAGLGSGAGLGSEVTRRALLGVAVYPLSLPCRRCPPTVAVPAHSGGGGPFQMRPRAVLPSCVPLVRRCMGDRVRKGGRVESSRRSGPQKPRRGLSRVAPGPPPPSACEKPVRRGSACVGDPSAGFALAPVCAAWHDYATWGPTARRAEGQNRGGGFSPLATLAESSDRRVSGPSVERARLRGRGGSDSLYRRSLLAGSVVAAVVPRSKPTSAGAQRSTQNWHGPGESDCLIKTKHCDGQR